MLSKEMDLYEMNINIFKDKSIINQEICTILQIDNSKTEGILLDIEVPIGYAGTEVILTIDEIREVSKVLEKEVE